MGRLLIVDDEAGLRGMLDIILRRDGHEVVLAANGQEALRILSANPGIELVLSDLRMEPMDGLALLSQVKQHHADVFVIIMTAFAEWDTAVRAMRQGAYNFLRKPFDNQAVRSLVARALDARGHYLAAKADGSAHHSAVHLVGLSKAMQHIQTTIEQVSTTDSTVLVTGESGTGKELVARAVHYASMRADGPLVRINSGALAPSLLESELFGHVKGAFTGAIDERQGLFALADGGTLFLDEVGELAPETQVKLLRVLESGEFLPVGGREVKTCNVRIVAATNRDLLTMVKSGDFREDLYYRLAVIPLHIPPLRERSEDIPVLAGHLLSRHAIKLRRGIHGFTQEALQAMVAYSWPGNIRELDNRIQRGAALTSSGDISYDAIFSDLATPPIPVKRDTTSAYEELRARIGQNIPINLEKEVFQFERTLMEAALISTDNNLTESAKLLGLTFRQMRYKVRQLGLRETKG
jgi:DNA-binding NtrC family response regulator